MLPPGTDFIIVYMDSLPVLAGSETGDSWSQCDSLEQDFTHQGRGEGGGGGETINTYIYRERERRVDYFFITDLQACFVGAWRSHSSRSYNSIYINVVFMHSIFQTCLHSV